METLVLFEISFHKFLRTLTVAFFSKTILPQLEEQLLFDLPLQPVELIGTRYLEIIFNKELHVMLVCESFDGVFSILRVIIKISSKDAVKHSKWSKKNYSDLCSE